MPTAHFLVQRKPKGKERKKERNKEIKRKRSKKKKKNGKKDICKDIFLGPIDSARLRLHRNIYHITQN